MPPAASFTSAGHHSSMAEALIWALPHARNTSCTACVVAATDGVSPSSGSSAAYKIPDARVRVTRSRPILARQMCEFGSERRHCSRDDPNAENR